MICETDRQRSKQHPTDRSSDRMPGGADWNWNWNGLGAPFWKWEGSPLGINPLSLPKSSLPERRRMLKDVNEKAARLRFFAKHYWTPQKDQETGYEYWLNSETGATQWEAPKVQDVVERARAIRSGELQLSAKEPDRTELEASQPPDDPPPTSAKYHRESHSISGGRNGMHMLNAREWAKFQQEEREIERLAQERKAARLAKIQARKEFLHGRSSLAIDIPRKVIEKCLRQLYLKGCVAIAFPSGKGYNISEASLGFSLVHRRRGGLMVAWTIPNKPLVKKAGLRRGMHLIEINQRDVSGIASPDVAAHVMAQESFPLSMIFRPDPNSKDELLSFFHLVCRAQRSFRRRFNYRRRIGAILVQTLARGYLAKVAVQHLRTAKNRSYAATAIQSQIRARLGRDIGRLKIAGARSPSSSISGWHICTDWKITGSAVFYVHSLKLDKLLWTKPYEIEYPVWERLWDSQETSWYYYNTRTMVFQWEQPHDYFDHEDVRYKLSPMCKPPYGLLLLNAAETVQRCYRKRLAKIRLRNIKRLRCLEHELDVGSFSDGNRMNNGSEWMQRHTKWEELANLKFEMGMWNEAADAFNKATDNFAARVVADSKKRKKEKRLSEMKGFVAGHKEKRKAFQLKGRSRVSTLISAPPGIQVDKCMRRLAVCMHKLWEHSHIPSDLNAATYALEGAFRFSENMNNPDVLLISARCHAAHGSFESALKILSRLITLMPYWEKIDSAVFFAAALLKAVGKYSRATNYFRWVQGSPFIEGRRFRPYILAFQMAHVYQLAAARDKHFGRHTDCKENEALAMSGFQSCYRLHPRLGGKNTSVPTPGVVKSWLSKPETWQELEIPLREAGCPLLEAECVSESFQRKTKEQQQEPNEWYRVALAAAKSGDLEAGVAWAQGALAREPYQDNFSEHVRNHIVMWDDENCQPGSDDDDDDGEEYDDASEKQTQFTRWLSPARKEKNRLDSHATVLQTWTRHCLQDLRILAPMRRLARWVNPTREELAAVLRCQVAYRKKHGGLGKHMRRRARKFQEERLRRMEAAALILQAAWRKKKGTYAKFILGRARKVAEDHTNQLMQAAIRIQCAWRKRQGTFAQHMLKAAKRDAERLARLRREKEEFERIQRWNVASIKVQTWYRKRFFMRMMNLVSAAVEQKRIYDRIVLTQSVFRGIRTRKWMARRHELATMTAAAFRGYMVRLGARLQQKLRQQVAGRKINLFIKESLEIRKREFLIRDDSAIKIQRLLRGFLVRWRAHAQFKTAVHLWGIEVLRNRLGPIPIAPGQETERANRDGELLANTIWCRYPCPNPGVLFRAAGAHEFRRLMPGAKAQLERNKAAKKKVKTQQKKMWKSTRTKQTVWGVPSEIRLDHDNHFQMPVLPHGRGALLPTYLNSAVPSFMLSQAVRVTPPHTLPPSPNKRLPSVRGHRSTDTRCGRWAVPREEADIERRRTHLELTKPIGGLVWKEDFATSLEKDVQALLRTRREAWMRRHDQSSWLRKKAKVLMTNKARLHTMVERQAREWEARHQKPAPMPKTTKSIFAKG